MCFGQYLGIVLVNFGLKTLTIVVVGFLFLCVRVSLLVIVFFVECIRGEYTFLFYVLFLCGVIVMHAMFGRGSVLGVVFGCVL